MRTLSKEELASVAGGWVVGVNIQNGNTQNGNSLGGGTASGKKSSVNNNNQALVNFNNNVNSSGVASDSSVTGSTIVNI